MYNEEEKLPQSPMAGAGLSRDVEATVRATEAFIRQLFVLTELNRNTNENSKESRDYLKEARGIQDDFIKLVQSITSAVEQKANERAVAAETSLESKVTRLLSEISSVASLIDKLFLRIVASGVAAGLIVGMLSLIINIFVGSKTVTLAPEEILKIKNAFREELIQYRQPIDNDRSDRFNHLESDIEKINKKLNIEVKK
jgi:hypothetical protein